MSWAKATSPSSATTGPALTAAMPKRRRERPVDAVGAAVGEHARSVVADRPEGLELAHRPSRRRRARSPARAARAASVRATFGSLSSVAERRRRRPPRRARRRRARRPARPGRRRRARVSSRGSARSTVSTTDAGSCQLPCGSTRIWRAPREAREPFAQRLGGRQVADADHELGLVRAREALVAQQQVVVGDRRRAAARARERVGEQRIAGAAAPAPGSPGARPASSRPATITPRRAPADERGERRPARGAGRGQRDPWASAGAPGASRGASRPVPYERLAQPPVEVHRAGSRRRSRRDRAAGQRAHPVLALGRRARALPTSKNQRTASP